MLAPGNLESHAVEPASETATPPLKDVQTVTPDGTRVGEWIDGLLVRRLRTLPDERGELCELYGSAWDMHDASVEHAYLATVRPGVVKGWVMHRSQDDRIAVLFGSMRWVWFDERPDSPTVWNVVELTITERNRALFVTPAKVWHAVENVGETDGAFINLPSKPYNYADPDKYRLPLENDTIPFSFGACAH